MISISDISCRLGRQQVFTGLNVSVLPGRIIGLLGKNGEGKTTLLKLIAGALFPDAGTIRVLDADPAWRLPDLLAKIFFVPEQPDIPVFTAERYGRHLAAFYPTFNAESFRRHIDLFEVKVSMPLRQMSFGQQKKVFLFGALASGCPLVLLDEPTNGLDLPGKALFRQFLAEAGSEERTFIISTHQTRDLASVLDSVAILHQGEIILNETLESIGETLNFRIQAEAPGNGVVYSQRTLGGYAVIDQPGSAEEATPDLELLFSAVIKDPHRMRAIFGLKKGEGHDG